MMGRVYKKSIIYTVCAVLLLVFLPAFINAEPVHAAGNNAKNYLGKAIYAENAGSDQVTWFSGAVGLNYTDGTSSVLTRPIDESEITDSGYLFGFIDAGGNVYDMEFAYTDPELGYTEWVLEGRGDDAYFLSTLASARKGEGYSFAYFGSRDQEVTATEVTFNDCTEHGFLTADSVPDDILTYPGVVVTENNDFIAFFTENQLFISLGTDPASFTGEDGGRGGNSPGGGSSGNGNPGGHSGGSSGNSPEIHEVPTDLDFTDDEKNQVGNGTGAAGVKDSGLNSRETAVLKKKKKFPVIPVAVGVLIITAGTVTAVIFIRKKKPGANAGASLRGGYGTDSGSGQAGGGEMLDRTIDLKAQRSQAQQDGRVSDMRRVSVIALGGGLRGREFGISGHGVTIGRDPSCEAVFPHDSKGTDKISRKHCKLFYENGRLLLMDLGSTNGTFMADGRQLTPMQPVPVKSGDRFYPDNPDNMFEIRM